MDFPLPRTGARIVGRNTILGVVAAGLLAAPAPGRQLDAAPEAVEMRTVKDSAAPCLNVRDSPSYDAPIVGCAEAGSRVQVTGARRGWSYVIVDEQLRGWAGTRFLQAADDREAETPAAESAWSDGELEPAVASTATPPSADSARSAPARSAPEVAIDYEEFMRVMGERDLARDQLAATTAQVEAAEAALAAQRDLVAAASELEESAARLRDQRDDLARRLARAEARQLYLQSDLEKTRAELMRLKGIPPALVEIEAPPEPPRLLPEPAPEGATSPAGAAFEIDLPEPGSVARLDEVVAVVRAWAEAWSDQRVDDYLTFYAPEFVPEDGTSRELWEAQRRVRITRPRSIAVTVDRINPMVSDQRAVVDFVQSYASDTFSDVVEKTLELERRVDGWRIVAERARD